MRPFSVVENTGFREMLRVLEPRYSIPSRTHFTDIAVPALYKETKAKLETAVSAAPAVALTSDGWTSRATQSYLTVTAHYIDPEWQMKNCVLQTRLVESHATDDLAKGLSEAVEDWKLVRPNVTISVTTDNAKNIVNAVTAAGLGPQIGCFAHTINIAAQKGMAVQKVSHLLAKMRRIVSFFHRSTTGCNVFMKKQQLLQLSGKKLIQDVPTRWNSSHDMMERYLEQQAAVYAAMADNTVKKSMKNIQNLTQEEHALAENLVTVMKTLKTVTVMMCEASSPTASMILPLKMNILNSMAQSGDDSPAVRDVKKNIREDLEKRYADPALQNYLHKCTALDPRFKSLRHLDNVTQLRVYGALTTELVLSIEQDQAAGTTETATSAETQAANSSDSPSASPPEKKSAMKELFGELFMSQEPRTRSAAEVAEEEINLYRLADCIPTDDNPLRWWKEHHSLYPHLSKLAQCYLVVPGTSVPSERVFSTAGDIVTASRSVLSAEHVDILIFLKKNMEIE
ncbi:E3 SUMO-protein ligase ZBED1 [Haplochromis burtoni]|uniref:E3 SUMO-protein ligase ZBED1 n=2 Tax=Pseudocrenilabrinae TaxID=318546 RepID=UPI001C2D1E00|nr:E3 SUMO-protein ligase ZBED1 [Haplochromis burtoni]